MSGPARPKTAKVCLACSTTFLGTPKATRCDTCRTTGVKVPSEIQQKRHIHRPSPRDNLPQHDKQCMACGCEFTTHKPRASRCNDCLAANKKVATRKCLECKAQFPLLDEAHVNCASCSEMLGVTQCEMTPEQQAKALEAEYLSRHQERLVHQRAWLDRRSKAPKGYPKMTQRTSKTPLGILWLQVCAADGAASSIMYAARSDDLTEEQKVSLLTTFYRLRAKGYHPSAIAKLCPRAILQDAPQAAITDLPQVTEPEPTTHTTITDWGRIAQAASLGLHEQGTTQ